jgi:RNA-directed DNA polymerase
VGRGPRPGEVLRPGEPRGVAEPGAPTGAGPAGADLDPPLPEGWRADPGGARGAYGGGAPARGPRSPLLANLLLDELDQELEQRGHRFARYADDANIYVRSRQAGERVLARVRRFLERKLRLKVNEAKSAVDRPWNRTVLGFTFTRRQVNRRKVSEKALKAFKVKVRALTGRTRGRTSQQIVQDLRQLILGWKAFFGLAEVRSPRRDLDKWIRRRLRSYHWKPWGRKRYRQLRTRGVSRQLAWNTIKSAHGPWRLSQSPALAIARPQRYVAALGLPRLSED